MPIVSSQFQILEYKVNKEEENRYKEIKMKLNSLEIERYDFYNNYYD